MQEVRVLKGIVIRILLNLCQHLRAIALKITAIKKMRQAMDVRCNRFGI